MQQPAETTIAEETAREEQSAAGSAPRERRGSWDFALVIATVGLLGALGIQSLAGTLYVWWAERTIAGWDQVGYPGYVSLMDAIAAPLVVALVLAIGLCVPRRLFSRRALFAASGLMLAVATGAWAISGSATVGLAAYLLLAAALQLAVVVMTAAGAATLTYLSQGRLTRLGSALLHLGFILFALVVAALQGSPWMSAVFWVAFALAIGGSALSFYSAELAGRLKPKS